MFLFIYIGIFLGYDRDVLTARQKIGQGPTDIEPMTIDQSVSFDQVGGLQHYVQGLSEMIVFPLLYPEVRKH